MLYSEAIAHEAELAVTSDDLRKMIRENQILNEELQRAGSDADRLQQELAQAISRVTYFEQLSKARETKKQELLRSYRKVGEEVSATKVLLQGECAC